MCDYLCDCQYSYSDNTYYHLGCCGYLQCVVNSIVNCVCCLPICCYGYYSTDPYQFTLESFNRLEDRYILCPDVYLICKYCLCRCCYDISYHDYNSLHGAAFVRNCVLSQLILCTGEYVID